MGKPDKLLAKMRANPRDWRMELLETVAKRHGIEVRKTGGSHDTLQTSDQTDLHHPVSSPAG
jgi:hypothetical protein